MDVTVRVKPGSRKGPLVDTTPDPDDETLTVYVPQRAVDGQANTAVIELLAHHFGVARSRVEILRGHSSRTKRIRIEE